MGKASRWIRNLLIGKKEEKGNTTTAIPAATPHLQIQRRRWSFRRSSSPSSSITTEKSSNRHKSCRSFDSIIASQLASQALSVYALHQQRHTAPVAVVPFEDTTKIARRVHEHAAATRIQAFYRSYLARKALCALRGLVKLQAVVRGHLVRKRTTAMVRCVNALVTIQLRARFQRIQMAEDDSQSQSQLTDAGRRSISSKRGLLLAQAHCDQVKGVNVNQNRASTTITHPQALDTYYSRLSTSNRDHRIYQLESSPSTRTSSTSYYERQTNEPNYMTRTESSRAKVRSQSEPKQRPMKQKSESRRTASNEGLTAITKTQINDHHGWLIKLYKSSKSIKDVEFDTTSTFTNDSSCCQTLNTYQPAVNLY